MNIDKISISRGNTKLPISTAIFNLPSGVTCPGANECKTYCYAKEAEKMYPAVLPARTRNLQAVLNQTFQRQIVDYLKASRGVRAFRIHESGDFFSQEYLDTWKAITNSFPRINFYAFTKSLNLSFADRQSNFIVIASTAEKVEGFDGQAIVIPKRANPPKGYFQCPGSCKVCNYCFTKTKRKKAVALGTGQAFDDRQKDFLKGV